MLNRFDGGENTVNVPPGNKPKPLGGWICPKCGLRLNASNPSCPQDGTKIEEAGLGQIDTALAERYEFIEVVGSGGMSVIYKAKQRLLDRIVAIKMLHSHVLDETTMMRFQTEAKASTSLQHPNVIKVHDFGVSEFGQPYMVMDYIDGPTLTELLKYRGSLPLPEAMEIFSQVSDALEHAHEHGVLHRDLKPSNIMLIGTTQGWDVRLVDFGIAKITEATDGIAHQLTRTGELFGSPLYMSPEQCMSKPVDQRSDIYALGCILYEMLVGQVPHCGDTMIETIFKHLNEQTKTLHEARPDILFPEQVEELVAKLLTKNPENRYQSMAEVKAQLANIQSSAIGGWAIRKKSSTKKWKPARSRVYIILGIATGMIGLGAFAFSQIDLRNQDETIRSLQKRNAELIEDSVHRSSATGVPKDSSAMASGAVPFSFEAMHDITPPNLMSNFYLQVLRFAPHDLWKDTSILQFAAYVPQLDEINLSDSKVTDHSMGYLYRFHGLKKLNLNGTKIKDEGLKSLALMDSLTNLELKDSTATPAGLKLLGNMKFLNELNLDRTNTNDDVLEAISTLPQLKVLSIRMTPITDKGLASLAKMKWLERLYITGTGITNRGLASISKMKLKELRLADTAVTGRGLSVLKDMTALESLTLDHIALKDSDLASLVEIPTLGSLDLSDTAVGDAGVAILAKKQNWNYINFRDTRITDGAADSLAGIKSMTSIGLEKDRISDKMVKKISTLPNLESLSLNDDHVTDESAEALAANTPNLKSVDLSGTEITDAGLMKLAALKDLKEVSLWSSGRITLQGMQKFKKKKKKVELRQGRYN